MSEDPVTERIRLGDTEVWESHKLTEATHLYATDQGWQDTSWSGPGEAIRIIAEFERAGRYV